MLETSEPINSDATEAASPVASFPEPTGAPQLSSAQDSVAAPPRPRRAPSRSRARPAASPEAEPAQAVAPEPTLPPPAETPAAPARPTRRRPVSRSNLATSRQATVQPSADEAAAQTAATESLEAPVSEPPTVETELPAFAEPESIGQSSDAVSMPEQEHPPLQRAYRPYGGEAIDFNPDPDALPAAREPTPAEQRQIEAAVNALLGRRSPGQRGGQTRGRTPTQTPPIDSAADDFEPEDWQVAELAAFEPMPPPTKRKAPRVTTGRRNARPSAETENAVDWALGRTSTADVDAAPPAQAEAIAASRRRRPRRGRHPLTGAETGLGADQEEQPVSFVPPEQPTTAPRRAPVPARQNRADTQLGTLEALVARQNVVLDAMLTRLTSFTSIERALTALEHRLSIQGAGGSGTAAPRVGIFVDVPNIIYAADRIGVTIDFGKVLNLLTHGRELVRAAAYAPISDDPQQRLDTQKFVQPFVRRGYRIVTKPLKRFVDGTIKGNFDVELALDILTMADRLDIVCLVSGDGDFSRLVDLVGSKGVRVEVVAFGASTSAELRAICDDYIDLSQHLSEIT